MVKTFSEGMVAFPSLKWKFVVLLVVIDQLTKALAFSLGSFKLLPFFSIAPVVNTGTVFGFFQGSNLFFILLTLLLLCAVFYFSLKEPVLSLGFTLIFAGGAGNLLDRLFHGYVLDFLQVSFFSVFNLADVFVVVGVFVNIFLLVKK